MIEWPKQQLRKLKIMGLKSNIFYEEQFLIKENLINKRSNEWLEMTDDLFNELYKNSPLKRAKLKGIKRNVLFIKD